MVPHILTHSSVYLRLLRAFHSLQKWVRFLKLLPMCISYIIFFFNHYNTSSINNWGITMGYNLMCMYV